MYPLLNILKRSFFLVFIPAYISVITIIPVYGWEHDSPDLITRPTQSWGSYHIDLNAAPNQPPNQRTITELLDIDGAPIGRFLREGSFVHFLSDTQTSFSLAGINLADLTIRAAGLIKIHGPIIVENLLSMRAKFLEVQGVLCAGLAHIELDASCDILEGGRLSSRGALNIAAPTIRNKSIISSQNLSLTAQDLIANDGTIEVEQDLCTRAGMLINTDAIYVQNTYVMDGDVFKNSRTNGRASELYVGNLYESRVREYVDSGVTYVPGLACINVHTGIFSGGFMAGRAIIHAKEYLHTWTESIFRIESFLGLKSDAFIDFDGQAFLGSRIAAEHDRSAFPAAVPPLPDCMLKMTAGRQIKRDRVVLHAKELAYTTAGECIPGVQCIAGDLSSEQKAILIRAAQLRFGFDSQSMALFEERIGPYTIEVHSTPELVAQTTRNVMRGVIQVAEHSINLIVCVASLIVPSFAPTMQAGSKSVFSWIRFFILGHV